MAGDMMGEDGIGDAAAAARMESQRTAVVQVLRLANILSGALPSSGRVGSGTRRGLDLQLRAINDSLTAAGAPALLDWDGTDYWGGTPTAVSSWSMGDATDAATPVASPAGVTTLGDAARALAERAMVTATAQAVAIAAYLGTATAEHARAWSTAFHMQLSSLVSAVAGRINDLATGPTTAPLRDFLGRWRDRMRSALDTAASAFGAGAIGFGGGLLVAFLAFLFLSRRRN